LNQYKNVVFLFEIDLASLLFFQSLSQISDDETSIETRQEEETAQDPSGKIMTPWTFSIKFSYDTQFTFESLIFAIGEDGDLELLTQGPAPKRLAPVYGQASYLLTNSSTLAGACLGLNPYTGSYHRAATTTQRIPIGAPIFQPSAGTSSSSTSTTSLDQDSTDNYPKIGGSTYWNSPDEGRLIIMVSPVRAPSQNSFSRYPTIGRSEASDARTPNEEMIWNLNLNFNVVWLQTIMESIQCMASKGSPLVALAKQGAEAANYIIGERSTDNPRGEPSIGN
jgi:hypothetical protein